MVSITLNMILGTHICLLHDAVECMLPAVMLGTIVGIVAIILVDDIEKEDNKMKLKEYYKMRHNYIIEDCKVLCADDYGCNDMGSHEWLTDHRGYTDAQFDATIRGSVFCDHVTICKGAEYGAVAMEELPDGILTEILRKAKDLYGSERVQLHNGSVMAEEGNVWKPRMDMGEYDCNTGNPIK